MHSPPLDLNLLPVFRALMVHRNVTHAAKELGLSQPAVSHALSRLRAQYHDLLFRRQNNRMEPTPRAIELTTPIAEALDQIAATANQKFDPSSLARTFRIGLVEYSALFLLPALMEKLGTEAPHVQVIPEQMHDELAHERLQDAEIDFAIGMIVGKRTDWRRLNLFDDRFVLIARRDHPLAKRKATAAIMAAQRHVRIPILDWLDLLLASRGIRRDYAVTSANILAVPFIVARSDLIAIVPNSVAVRFMDFCHLREIEPPIELPTYVIDLVYHVRYEINPAHRWMKDTIVTIAAHMRRDPGRFPRSRSHTGR